MSTSHLQATIDQVNSPQNIAELSRAMGVDEATARKAVNAALPALIGGLGKNASTPEGADALAAALDVDHDGSILDDLDAYMASGGDVEGGQRIVGHVLGDRSQQVEDGLGRGLGISGKQVGTLLAALAPIVLGALSKDNQESSSGPGGLTEMLLGPQSPVLGMLGASNDSPAAALAGLVGGLMGSGTGSSGSSDIGSLLGGLLGSALSGGSASGGSSS